MSCRFLLLFGKKKIFKFAINGLDMSFKKEYVPWNKGKSSWNKGLHLTEEHRKKLSEKHKGKTAWNKGKKGVFSEETRKKHSEFMKEYYKTHKHPLSGKKQSRESIEKARESRRITLLNPEIRRKLGESHKGQLAWNKGKVMSKEIRQKMHKITLEEMQQIAKVRRGVCLSEEYAGSGNSLKWRCERGHEWEATPHNIKKDKWCPVCSTRIGEKICKNYFETFFQEKFPKAHPNWLKSSTGKNLELDGYCEKLKLAFEYQGEQHYIPNHYFNKTFSLEKIKQHDEFKKNKCSENKIILIQVPYHIDYEKLGRWIEEECKKIGLNPLINAEKIDYRSFDVYSSKSLEEMQQIAKKFNGSCLSDAYVNGSTKLKWKCKKGHFWEAKPSDVKRGRWCPVCSVERAKYDWKNQSGTASEFQRDELNNLKFLAKSKNGECLSDKYVNNSTHLQWKCKKGHIWKAKPGNIKSGKWCPKCAYEYIASLRRGNISDMDEIAKRRGGKCLSDKYINVDTKLKWQCQNGHTWEAIPSSIKRGSWCPKCARH